jgi:hypothetical protein
MVEKLKALTPDQFSIYEQLELVIESIGTLVTQSGLVGFHWVINAHLLEAHGQASDALRAMRGEP